MEPQTQSLTAILDSLGLTELTGIMIAVTAFSGAFYFVLGLVKPIIGKIWQWIKRGCCYEVDVFTSDATFDKFNMWLGQNKQHIMFERSFRPKRYDIKSSNLVSGYGTILIRHPDLPLISMTRSEVEKKQVYEQIEQFKFKVFTFRKSKVLDFYKQVISTETSHGPFVYQADNSYWKSIGTPKQVLSPMGKSCVDLLEDIETFRNSENEYKARGIPYRRGYLLYGMPGTGKTSLICHLAQKYKMNIYLASTDAILNFENLMSDVKPNSLILIEDIDMTLLGERRNIKNQNDEKAENVGSPVREQPKENDLMSFSTKIILRDFLNILDGICEFNSIVIATTNKREALDAALLRPGRIDRQIYVGPLTTDEQVAHFNRFFETKLDPKDFDFPLRTVAEIQHLCVSNITDVETATNDLVN